MANLIKISSLLPSKTAVYWESSVVNKMDYEKESVLLVHPPRKYMWRLNSSTNSAVSIDSIISHLDIQLSFTYVSSFDCNKSSFIIVFILQMRSLRLQRLNFYPTSTYPGDESRILSLHAYSLNLSSKLSTVSNILSVSASFNLYVGEARKILFEDALNMGN